MDQLNQNEHQGVEGKTLPFTSLTSGLFQQVAEGVSCYTVQIVNIAFVEKKDGFIMVDAGMPGSADRIVSEIETRFGAGAKPDAIVLTHGHFDHIGALENLLEKWNIPVYAHRLEFPYLTGEKNYPKPDPTVEGGLVAKLSPMFPNEGINISGSLQTLPEGGNIPFLPEWIWLHTPGHSEGHISLFREKDRALIAGDAFVTVKQDSLYKVMTQEQEINGPPRYLTTDWQSARTSVEKLAALKPETAITGHGLPMEGEELQQELDKLAAEFDRIAVPDYGKYI